MKAIVLSIALLLPGAAVFSAECAPVQLALWPTLQTSQTDKFICGFRLNLGMGDNADVTGFDLGLLNAYEHSMRGLQIGAVNTDLMRGGLMKGVQFGFINFQERLYGIQGGAINAMGTVNGLSLGMVNVQDINGIQIGMVNVAKRAAGVQFGIINMAYTLKGIQIGVINYHGEARVAKALPIINAAF